MPFVHLGAVELEYRTVPGDPDKPWLVFLHEGLGSVELWREFPDRVAGETGHPALIYSREGHGWSTPISGSRKPDFMDHEALNVLPALLERLSIEQPLLIGHSDGASIALIHAAHRPVAALVALAPHVFVEPASLAGVAAAGRAFEETDLSERMAHYHHDPDATFRGWHGTWMSPAFRDWNIERTLSRIDRPVLLVQGEEDEYGTQAQLTAIEEAVGGPVQRVWLERCGHAPHLDQPQAVEQAVTAFIDRFEGRFP